MPLTSITTPPTTHSPIRDVLPNPMGVFRPPGLGGKVSFIRAVQIDTERVPPERAVLSQSELVPVPDKLSHVSPTLVPPAYFGPVELGGVL